MNSVDVSKTPVDEVTREAVLRDAAKKISDLVARTKDVDSAGAMAGFGEGDPRATERRDALSVLLADKSGKYVDLTSLRGLGEHVTKDIAFLIAEATEYTATGTKQFDWNKEKENDVVISPRELQREFDSRVAAQKEIARKFSEGELDYMDVSTTSVIGLSMIPDRDRRAQGLVDALWQFRARDDQANQTEGWGNADRIRIDRSGIALVAEQRVLLANADFSQDSDGMREYALTREVIASHPISSTNGIFAARNAISAMLTDQGLASRDSFNNPLKWLRETDSVPPGASAAPYRTIHWNYSRDTPQNIEAFVNEWMFPKGPQQARGVSFCTLIAAMQQARAGELDRAKQTLQSIAGSSPEVDEILAEILGHLEVSETGEVGGAKLADTIRDELKRICTKPLGQNVEANLACAALLYRSICAEQPNADWLESNLLRARGARDAVANVLVCLERGDDIGILRELGVARLALRDAILETPLGAERHDMIRFDAQLVRLCNEELGGAVDAIGTLSTPAERGKALVALQAALRGAVASGLHALRDNQDENAQPAQSFTEVAARVDAFVERVEGGATVALEDYRAIMSDAHRAVVSTVQNIRALFQSRRIAVASGGADLDPEFDDQFIKQSPLHYATAIAEAGMRCGLVQKIGPRCIENIDGMRVLNSVGPVVFGSVVAGESTKNILETEHERDALAIVYKLDEKKMIAGIGGLLVDAENAPGGNSHLNMYAMNNGIPVVALPELRNGYAELFANAKTEGGLYIDDTDGNFRMMTVDYALENGFIKADRNKPAEVKKALESLRPGNNRNIKYLKPTADDEGFELLDEHRAEIAPGRLWREIEIYVPRDEVRGIGRECVSFKDLATLGVHARHIAGEKGTVLALLKAHPELGKYVPDGSVVGTGRVRSLLSEINLSRVELTAALGRETADAWGIGDGLSLSDAWDAVWKHDPSVGTITKDNFKASAFYKDDAYRKSVREGLQHLTLTAVTRHLVEKQAGGKERLSAAGEQIYGELLRNASPAPAPGSAPRLDVGLGSSWIFRSSFTGEDRPGKSGAGQYESVVDMKVAKKMVAEGTAASIEEALPVARMKALAAVLESTWMPEPIENNVSEEFFLQYIYPSATVQTCLAPDFSGVAVSRDTETGGTGVSVQLVPGFGGGVEGGKTTEAVITRNGCRVTMINGDAGAQENDADTVLVGEQRIPAAVMQELHDIVTKVERYFDEAIEPGKGHAVDMEMAYQDGQWWVVQARVILVDK